MTPHRDTINRQIGEDRSYEQMMRAELKARFMSSRQTARNAAYHHTRTRAVNWMAFYRREISRLPEWASKYR